MTVTAWEQDLYLPRDIRGPGWKAEVDEPFVRCHILIVIQRDRQSVAVTRH